MLQGVKSIRAIQASDSKTVPASLPLDTWIEIAISLAKGDHVRDVVSLLGVCKLLRSALHQTHQLWTKLEFNNQDNPRERKFPVPKYDSIRQFLINLPASSVQIIRWRPESSEAMVNIIQFTLQKFDTLELLDVRPHLGNSTSEYLQAAYTALRQLHDTNIRCTKFRTLMLANTSFRQETIMYKRDTALMDSLQQELEWLANREQKQDEIQPAGTKVASLSRAIIQYLTCACLALNIAQPVML
ncbi:hypothetical protein BC943DRAFT_358030 [Umbelopsis sp. AD052]|nr:hypothetical protein BC943DRAFT_358030 [Umbelopsis sp. AD052]